MRETETLRRELYHRCITLDGFTDSASRRSTRQIRRTLKRVHALFILPNNQGEYETFTAAIMAANEWIKTNSVRVISIETVVLPNIWERWEEGSQDPALRTFRKPIWHQFVRVWHEQG